MPATPQHKTPCRPRRRRARPSTRTTPGRAGARAGGTAATGHAGRMTAGLEYQVRTPGHCAGLRLSCHVHDVPLLAGGLAASGGGGVGHRVPDRQPGDPGRALANLCLNAFEARAGEVVVDCAVHDGAAGTCVRAVRVRSARWHGSGPGGGPGSELDDTVPALPARRVCSAAAWWTPTPERQT